MVTAIVNSYETYAIEKFGSKVSRLEIPIIGSFTGPYWTTFFCIGAILGFVAFSVIVIIGTPEFLTRKLMRRAKLAGSVKSDSYQFNRANPTRATLT